jgi:tetratricopeptide (TPR) repeat protein
MYYLKVAVMIDPTNADTNYQIGLIYQHRNDANRAIHYYSEALKQSPGYISALDNIAVMGTYNQEPAKMLLGPLC